MFTLPELSFSPQNFEPYISAKTFEFHYGKHHKAYVDNLNKLYSKENNGSEEELLNLAMSLADEASSPLRNNAIQAYNHSFFWKSLKLDAKMDDGVRTKIVDDFGSVEEFKKQFLDKATTLFGSGWVFVALENGKMVIKAMPNAGVPKNPLIVLDVWEHAYYLDYQNRRADFASQFLDKLINWEFLAQNMELALKK
jgi:Fe-Mn family superoxide dismutase